MKKLKHKKYRNTGLIWEMLTRQITSDILEDKKNSAATEILQEYFGSDTEMARELELYRLLMNETFQNEEQAKDFLKEVVETRKNLDFDRLQEEKYNIIGEIKDKYPLKEFFKSRVDNYRELASVYKTFKALCEDVEYEPDDLVRSKYTIIEHVTNGGVDDTEEKVESEIRENFREESRDLRLLAQKVMINKFNEKYGELLPEQKELLRKYINNISNTNNLREDINNRVDNLKTELSGLRDKIDEEVVDIKVQEALNLIDEIKSEGGQVRDDEISNLLMYYQLREDIKQTLKNKQKA
jgi:hypothetical protein